jgi:hypothetical protein
MKRLTTLLALAVLLSCQKKEEPIVILADDLHNTVDQVTDIMIHDIFSPPVASRVYAYPNIAAYEIMALNNDDYLSLANQASGLTEIPRPDASKAVNYPLAALIAHIDMSKRLIFSEDWLKSYRDSLYTIWTDTNETEFNHSKA